MPDYLYFWGHTPAQPQVPDKSCFSQWFPSPFSLAGVTYATAEHYMMVGKARLFADEAIAAQMLAAPTPDAVKGLGRRVRAFDHAVWEAHRFDLVVAGNVAKFGQHPALAGYLLGTGTRVLVEASPVDAVWGIGLAADDRRATDPAAWPGLNLLGFALMRVRATLAVGESANR